MLLSCVDLSTLRPGLTHALQRFFLTSVTMKGDYTKRVGFNEDRLIYRVITDHFISIDSH